MNTPLERAARATRWLCLALIAVSCKANTTSPRTEILLQIDADSQVRAQANGLRVDLASGPRSAPMLGVQQPELYDLTSEAFRWPASLALIALPGHEDYQFSVTITAQLAGVALARGRVQSSFVRDQTLWLQTALFRECIGKLDCGDDQTCVVRDGQAECASAEVDPMSLPAFVPGNQPGAGAAAANGGQNPGPGGSAGQLVAGAGARDAGQPPVAGGVVGYAGRPEQAGTGGPAGASGCPGATEICDNGVDDDCNGLADCADPACFMMMCTPSDGFVGVIVPAASPCPNGFAQGEQRIYQGLMDLGCSGCGCSTAPVQCMAHVYFYSDVTACMNDLIPYSGGTLLDTPITYACSPSPIGDSQGIGTPKGWRVSIDAVGGECTAAGNPTLAPPIWSVGMKLCTAKTSAAGCPMGQLCLPRPNGYALCTQTVSKICPQNTALQSWYLGYNDTRSCGACTCSTTGGNCSGVAVELGSSTGCGTIADTLHSGQLNCAVSVTEPPAMLTGSATAACDSNAPELGALQPTSALDLCCTANTAITP